MDKQEEYLGDGLYASYDGYELVLKANSHISPTDTVYLEPAVWEALKKFVERAKTAMATPDDQRPNLPTPPSGSDE